ncbi:MAG: acyltransferase [Gammaproteobacteria bacterium]|jgi:N-carbamoylputrescine amidase|nr:acyltransferase [Gammaproteobacteria bacterium]
MNPRRLDIALVQHAMGPDAGENRAATADGIARSAELGAGLVLLPELHASEYFCKYQDPELFDLAERLDGPTCRMLAQAAEQHGVVVIGSIFEHRAPGLAHNTAVVFERDGSLAGVYRKMHIPDDPGYNEKFYFTPGDLGFEPIDTSVGRLGVLVCWDQWYPEAARLMALAGAELLLYPTAIGLDLDDEEDEQRRQLEAWRTIQRSHAIANGIPMATCNRVGFEPDRSGGEREAEFWGHSLVAGPQGEILAEAGSEAEVLFASLDLRRSEAVRRIWPFMRDRRIDAYGDLLKRWRS